MTGHLQSLTGTVEDSEEILGSPKEKIHTRNPFQGASPQIFLFNVLPPKSSALSK